MAVAITTQPKERFLGSITAMYCASCYYDLSHCCATTNCCPECGREFDHSNPATFSSYVPYYPTLRDYVVAILIVIGGFVILAIGGFLLDVNFEVPK